MSRCRMDELASIVCIITITFLLPKNTSFAALDTSSVRFVSDFLSFADHHGDEPGIQKANQGI